MSTADPKTPVDILKDALVREQSAHDFYAQMIVNCNCSGSRPKAGGHLRVNGGASEPGAWARLTRC